MTAIVVLRYILLAATAAMFVLHLTSTTLLKRGVRAVTLLRFEVGYYAMLLAALLFPAFRMVIIPAIALAAIHAAAWIYSELRHAGTLSRTIMIGVLIFDSAEALVLAGIAFALFNATA